MHASPPTTVGPLEYEQRKPFYRRRVPRQVFVLLAGALLLSVVWYFTPTFKDLSIASWHRRCASYVPAAGQVLYDDDPTTYPQLLGRANYVGNLLRQDRPYAVRENPEWKGMIKARHGFGVGPVAFLGARTSPGGTRRLVAVQFGTVYPDPQWLRLMFMPYVESTGFTGLRNYGVGNAATRSNLELFRHRTDNLRVLDGQPDPNDPSRFTIDLVINGTPHTIDGQLQDDDGVTLTPRASKHVKFMNSVYWNPTGVKMFDWLSRVPGAPPTTPPTTQAAPTGSAAMSPKD